MTQTQTLKLKTLRTGRGEPWIMCRELIKTSRRKRAGRETDIFGNHKKYVYEREESVEPCGWWCHGSEAYRDHLLRVHGKTGFTMSPDVQAGDIGRGEGSGEEPSPASDGRIMEGR